MDYLPSHFFLGLGVFTLVAVLVLFSKRFYESYYTNPAVIKKGASLVRQSADFAFNAQQMTNPLLALRNANYAKAYLDAACAMAPEDELHSVVKIHISELYKDIEREEIAAKERILQMCPQAAGRTRLAQTTGFDVRQPIRSDAAKTRSTQYRNEETADVQFTPL